MNNINNIAIESIKSSTVRNYLKSINHEFKIEEQISLIFNSDINLHEKVNIFRDLIKNDTVAENIKEELKEILNNIDIFESITYSSGRTAFLFFDEDNEVICANTLAKVQKYNINNKITEYIRVIDLESEKIESNTLYDIKLNDNGEVARFFPYEAANYVFTKVEDNYVDIPNEFKVGDIVKIYNQKEKYVVVSDSTIPEHLKPNCDFIDTSITVVPKSIFNNNTRSYKEQIEDIYRNRIRHIEYSEPIIDVISREHEHINITILEKV